MLIPTGPKPEQVEIALRLEAVDARLASERSDLEKLRLMRQGLRDDLLTGRVRVTSVLGESAA